MRRPLQFQCLGDAAPYRETSTPAPRPEGEAPVPEWPAPHRRHLVFPCHGLGRLPYNYTMVGGSVRLTRAATGLPRANPAVRRCRLPGDAPAYWAGPPGGPRRGPALSPVRRCGLDLRGGQLVVRAVPDRHAPLVLLHDAAAVSIVLPYDGGQVRPGSRSSCASAGTRSHAPTAPTATPTMHNKYARFMHSARAGVIWVRRPRPGRAAVPQDVRRSRPTPKKFCHRYGTALNGKPPRVS